MSRNTEVGNTHRIEKGEKWIDFNSDGYKPGQGVNMSAAEIGMRLTRTETNAAYRLADQDR